MMDAGKRHAIIDMKAEGLKVTALSMDYADILDPMVEYGFAHGSEYLDMQERKCSAIGALVLGMNLENKFPERTTPGLLQTLSKEYGVPTLFLEGMEAATNGDTSLASLPFYRQRHDFTRGYTFGQSVLARLDTPPKEPGIKYEA